MADLELPVDVRPLSLPGVFTSQYEIDTLPLLFSPDGIFTEYYDALARKNSHISNQLEDLRQRNRQAREHRASGMWQECIDSLWQCVELRRDLFDATDFQLTAAQRHFVLTLLNFATYFLKEGGNGRTSGEEAMFFRSFGLFKRAEECVTIIDDRTDRMLLKAMVENNYAAYYTRRRKQKAASQRMTSAIKAYKAYLSATSNAAAANGGADGNGGGRADGGSSDSDDDSDVGGDAKGKKKQHPACMSDAEFKSRTEQLYFSFQGGTSDIFCGRFEEALKKLLAAVKDAETLLQAVEVPPEEEGEGERPQIEDKPRSHEAADRSEGNGKSPSASPVKSATSEQREDTDGMAASPQSPAPTSEASPAKKSSRASSRSHSASSKASSPRSSRSSSPRSSRSSSRSSTRSRSASSAKYSSDAYSSSPSSTPRKRDRSSSPPKKSKSKSPRSNKKGDEASPSTSLVVREPSKPPSTPPSKPLRAHSSGSAAGSESGAQTARATAQAPPDGGFAIQIMGTTAPTDVLTVVGLFHNIAVAYVGLRKHGEASKWEQRALDVALGNSESGVSPSGNIAAIIKRSKEFCDKMSFRHTRRTGQTASSAAKMRSSVKGGSMMVATQQERPPQSRRGTSADINRRQHNEEDRKSSIVAREAFLHPKSAEAARAYMPRHASPRYKEASAVEKLQTYLKGLSYRQLVEDYGIDDGGKYQRQKQKGAAQKKDPAQAKAEEKERVRRRQEATEQRKADLVSAQQSRVVTPRGPARQSKSPSVTREATPRASPVATPRRDEPVPKEAEEPAKEDVEEKKAVTAPTRSPTPPAPAAEEARSDTPPPPAEEAPAADEAPAPQREEESAAEAPAKEAAGEAEESKVSDEDDAADAEAQRKAEEARLAALEQARREQEGAQKAKAEEAASKEEVEERAAAEGTPVEPPSPAVMPTSGEAAKSAADDDEDFEKDSEAPTSPRQPLPEPEAKPADANEEETGDLGATPPSAAAAEEKETPRTENRRQSASETATSAMESASAKKALEDSMQRVPPLPPSVAPGIDKGEQQLAYDDDEEFEKDSSTFSSLPTSARKEAVVPVVTASAAPATSTPVGGDEYGDDEFDAESPKKITPDSPKAVAADEEKVAEVPAVVSPPIPSDDAPVEVEKKQEDAGSYDDDDFDPESPKKASNDDAPAAAPPPLPEESNAEADKGGDDYGDDDFDDGSSPNTPAKAKVAALDEAEMDLSPQSPDYADDDFEEEL